MPVSTPRFIRPKRSYSSVCTFEDILDDDLKHESRKARMRMQREHDQVISLAAPTNVGHLRPSWLPPKLRERFFSSLPSS